MADQPGYQNRRNRPSQEQDSFRPHERYPRLNANAGSEDSRASRRTAARRPAAGSTRSSGARPRVRLDSSYEVPSMSTRPERRRTRTRARSNSNFTPGRVLSGIGMVAFAILGYWLLNSSTFYVSKIELKGNHYLNSQEVIKATGVDKSNVFTLNEDEVTGQLKKLPYVLSVKASKGLPDKLNVEVTERVPAYNWKIGGMCYLVDRDGVVLEAVFEQDLSPDAQAFPVIQSLDDRKLKVGDKVDATAVRSSQAIQTQLTDAGFKLAAIQYAPGSGLIAVSAPESGNWKALLGSDAELDKKIEILKGLLADKSLKWSLADLRFVNKPAIS
ncbi:MAG TPA: FtsQ-type POTRA domain-containing protein [Chloroflexia bacterium]|nr:FtsQ-type POTRA domain-containing protein [Chloroflexia bacterium]